MEITNILRTLDLLGLSAIAIAALILGVLKLFGVKHNLGLLETAGWVIGAIGGSLFPALLLLVIARYFGLWPFSN